MRTARSGQRVFWGVLGAIVLAYFATRLLWLGSSPLVWMDEPWLSQPAWMLASGDGMRLPMFAFEGTSRDVVFYGLPVQQLVLACIFRLFGLGVVGARMGSVLAGAATIVVLALLGRRVLDPTAGLIAAGILVLDPLFFIITRTARPEAYATALSLLTIYLYQTLVRDRERWWGLAAVGLCGAIAAQAHLYGGFSLAAVLAIEIFERRSLRGALAAVGLVAVGCAAGLVPYGIWISVNPEAFVAQWTDPSIASKTPTLGLAGLLGSLLSEPSRWTSVSVWPAFLAAWWFGLGGLLLTPRGRWVASLALIQVALFALLVSSKHAAYLGVTLPLAALGVAAALRVVLREPVVVRSGNRWASWHFAGVLGGSIAAAILSWPMLPLRLIVYALGVGACLSLGAAVLARVIIGSDVIRSRSQSALLLAGCALVVPALALSTSGAIRQLSMERGSDYYAYSAAVADAVPQGSIVVAQPMLWLGMSSYEFHAFHAVFPHANAGEPQSTIPDYLGRTGAEYLVVDGWVHDQAIGDGSYLPDEALLQLRASIDSASVVARVEDDHYGASSARLPGRPAVTVVLKLAR